jgi:peptidoglycan/xylan/chitin deacetylase (PgdA/CDA1 family)
MGAKRALSSAALRLARTPAAERVAGGLERVDRRSARMLTILTYHRVDYPGAQPLLDPALLSAAPAEFERQIAHVAARHRPLSLDELLAVRRGEAELPERAVLVTFDDGYRDFAENAWPVLRRHGVPATLFVPTAYPGDRSRRFWWDRLHAAFSKGGQTPFRKASAEVSSMPHDEAMRRVDELVAELGEVDPGDVVLSWDELRSLADEGVALAAHTRTHPRLDRLPLDQAVAEVRGSIEDLKRETGSAPAAFAYPEGGHADDVVRALADEGVEVAFTTERGVNDLRRPDWLRLRRINVGRRSSVGAISLQVLASARFATGAAA